MRKRSDVYIYIYIISKTRARCDMPRFRNGEQYRTGLKKIVDNRRHASSKYIIFVMDGVAALSKRKKKGKSD